MKISGFQNKEELLEKLKDAGVEIKLPFKATGFKCSKDMKKFRFKDKEGKEFKPAKKEKKPKQL